MVADTIKGDWQDGHGTGTYVSILYICNCMPYKFDNNIIHSFSKIFGAYAASDNTHITIVKSPAAKWDPSIDPQAPAGSPPFVPGQLTGAHRRPGVMNSLEMIRLDIKARYAAGTLAFGRAIVVAPLGELFGESGWAMPNGPPLPGTVESSLRAAWLVS